MQRQRFEESGTATSREKKRDWTQRTRLIGQYDTEEENMAKSNQERRKEHGHQIILDTLRTMLLMVTDPAKPRKVLADTVTTAGLEVMLVFATAA